MTTFIADWVIQDLLIYAIGIITILFIIKKEPHPDVIILEMICFCLMDAAVYENLATYIGLYGYGQSLIMVWNVPLSIPIVEFIVVYSSLRLTNHMKIPTWSKPIIVGLLGMLFDFTLDPVATKEIFSTTSGTIGRWTWFIGANAVNIYGEPVYNFTGWILLCGYGAAFLLLGRYWYQKSNYNRRVGYTYPILCMFRSLNRNCLTLLKFLTLVSSLLYLWFYWGMDYVRYSYFDSILNFDLYLAWENGEWFLIQIRISPLYCVTRIPSF